MDGGNQFESLKREATKLERQLEEKIGRYQQVSNRQWITQRLWFGLFGNFVYFVD
jgi:hypothetical protein